MYGAQTPALIAEAIAVFENDVEMYGAQTALKGAKYDNGFENDVEMYGAQTLSISHVALFGLRMMQKCMVLKPLKDTL